MRHDRLLIGLLLLATALVDCAVLWSCTASRSPPRLEVQFFTLHSLALSQTSLAAIWAGLGKRSTPWRLVGVFLLAVLWSRGLAATVFWLSTIMACFLLLLPQAVMVVVLLWIARPFGVRVVRGTEPPPAENVGWRPQFSLRHLFAWTTATAIVLGVSTWVFRDGPELLQWLRERAVWEAQVFNACNALMAFATLWAALSNRALARRISVLLLILVAAFALLPRLPGGPKPTLWALILTLQSVLLLASLWVFRVAGYRLTCSKR